MIWSMVQAVHTALSGVGGLPANAVVCGEPLPGGLPRPLAVTVALGGLNPEEVLVDVRVYADVTATDVLAAQASMADLIDEVEDRLDAVNAPRSTYARPGYSEAHGAIIATTTLNYPRDDLS